MKTIRLRPGKERSLLRRHPWIFQGSIDRGHADAGETVRVEASDGRFLCWGAWSPTSAIRVRAWTFDEHERADHAFFKRRIARAVALRDRMGIAALSDGVRLVHGEADGLPGLIVDRYGPVLSAQFLAAGTERFKDAIVQALVLATGCEQVYERSDSSVRALEGLAPVTGWLRGGPPDAPGPAALEVPIREHDWTLTVDIAGGHKTGFYLDQRDNRLLFSQWVRRLGSGRVLNTYCYTGGFSVAALAGGAGHVTSVDSSAPALARAQAHVQAWLADHPRADGRDAAQVHETVDADVNRFLRDQLQAGSRFDAIVLDPPKFAPSAAHAERAARAYKDINRLALKLLAPGGLLLTFSCSGGIGAELFHKIVAGAAADAGVDGALLQRLQGAPDHPTTLAFPEGEYLKGLAILKA